MAPGANMLVRRIGGVILVVVGAALLVGPVGLTLWTRSGVSPKVLYDLAYIVTLGLFLLILGSYFLTRRAKKAPEEHDRR